MTVHREIVAAFGPRSTRVTESRLQAASSDVSKAFKTPRSILAADDLNDELIGVRNGQSRIRRGPTRRRRRGGKAGVPAAASLRHSVARVASHALRAPARARWRPQELGGRQGPQPGPVGSSPGCRERGSSARIRRIRGPETPWATWRRLAPAMGRRHVASDRGCEQILPRRQAELRARGAKAQGPLEPRSPSRGGRRPAGEMAADQGARPPCSTRQRRRTDRDRLPRRPLSPRPGAARILCAPPHAATQAATRGSRLAGGRGMSIFKSRVLSP